MSNVIDFNAREFCFDSAIENQAGTRKYVTDSSGSSCEVFEIGDWCWSWSQIRCTKCLQPDADYVFRFAMTGGFNDTQDAISQFIIFYDEQWDDRYVYSLARSEFKPMFSKCCDGQLLRVYEIPFHTGNNRETTFMFVAQHAVACFMPAREADYYAGMEDLDYATWWEEHRNLLESRQQSNGENSMEGCKGTDGEYNFHSEGKQNVAIDLSGAIMSRGTLEKLLEVVKYRDGKIDLSGTVINDD